MRRLWAGLLKWGQSFASFARLAPILFEPEPCRGALSQVVIGYGYKFQHLVSVLGALRAICRISSARMRQCAESASKDIRLTVDASCGVRPDAD
jgi:hypothetical protein